MRFRRRDILHATLGGFAAAPLAGFAADEPKGYCELVEGFRAYVPEQLARDKVVGAAVAIVDTDAGVWAEGFGHTGSDRAQPVTADTVFSLQSISKTYTAMLALEATERGWFRLEDPLVHHLPDFTVRSLFGEQEAARITLRQLLSHWSGLPHEAPVGNNYDDGTAAFADHIESIRDVWLLAPPGTRYAYSNLGFDLIAWLLQTRSGTPFAELADRRLLRRLGMSASSFDRAKALAAPSLARGQDGGRDVEVHIPMLGAGGLYSTARDMARFVSAQLAGTRTPDGGRLLSPAGVEAMRTPQFPVDHQSAGYGLGLFRRRAFGTTMCSHGGGGYGFDTEQRWFPELGLGVVVLTNDGDGSDIAQTLADHLSEAVIRCKAGPARPEPPARLTDRPVQAATPEELKKFEGRYRAYSGMRSFAVVNGVLHYRVGSSERPLDFHGDGEFTTADERFRFRLGHDGAPFAADDLGSVGADTFVLNDRPGEPPGADKPQWRAFVGDYAGFAYGETVPLKIFLQNGFLYASRAGGSKLFEYRPGLFFTAWGESVEFDAEGLRFGNRRFRRAA